MQTLTEIRDAASFLGDYLDAGIPIVGAISNLHRQQPKAGWNGVAEKLARGDRLSDCLPGMWPDIFVSSVIAGEESGKLPSILKNIEHTTNIQLEIKSLLKGLLRPAALIVLGSLVLAGYMLFVIPMMAKTMGGFSSRKQDGDYIIHACLWLNEMVFEHWQPCLAALLAIAVFVVNRVRQPEFVDWLFEVADAIPKLNDSLRILYFGLWARSLALLTGAGIAAEPALRLSARNLPLNMRAGVLLMADDTTQRGLADSGSTDNQAPGDPRLKWPFAIGCAFAQAEQIGDIEYIMNKIAPGMITQGTASLKLWIASASNIALLITGVFSMLPTLFFYLELGQQMKESM
ncbi:type II secretion system F family protein [Candidatus Methylospira mobilis]|uniref:type II secretion system F family protein n=1 Tax=Candidatus Methylospira mobilis TaxID=1808979 RepID=UPI0028E6CD50|nr:type II secretion system F family protein [Candidatus Methylospira mobilis]WNV05868.1 type II secretion system F family protein [Candidatus Methylospira mobilis]